MFARKKQPPIKSLVAHGTRIRGQVHFEEGLRIDGEVEGDVTADPAKPSLLVISETAKVLGAIESDHVIINGTVMGPVRAKELLELQPTARIHGDVSYRALEMHQGATIAGQLQPIDGATDEEKPLLTLAAKNA